MLEYFWNNYVNKKLNREKILVAKMKKFSKKSHQRLKRRSRAKVTENIKI